MNRQDVTDTCNKGRASLLLALAMLFVLIGQAWAERSETVTYYHTDGLGSVIAASDENGNLLWRERYRPFGERFEMAVSTDEHALYYTGKPHDDDTGLTYFGARYYDPVLGRFMGIDPAGVDPGNLHSFNRYAYANNNPYRYVDPDGRAIETAIDVISFGLSIAAFQRDPGFLNGVGVAYDGLATFVPFLPAGVGILKSASRAVDSMANGAKRVSNPVPSTVARVVPDSPITRASGTLGRPDADDVFVTAVSDIRGLNAEQIAKQLTIPESPAGFRVIEFPTPRSGIASPVNRADPGFIGGGRTAGGAREFVIPNGSVPANATIRVVR